MVILNLYPTSSSVVVVVVATICERSSTMVGEIAVSARIAAMATTRIEAQAAASHSQDFTTSDSSVMLLAILGRALGK